MVKPINIGGRMIGPGHPCFIIAEAGVNHNGDLEMARQLVKAAAATGADAVKFQTFEAHKVVSATAPKAAYQNSTTDPAESQLDMIRKLELNADQHRELITLCGEKGVIFLSSPFDEDSVDLLASLGVSAIKIPSGEITNLPLVTRSAGKGKPMIVSTGMAYLSEVEIAVRAIEETGNRDYVLLHCVSNYPAAESDVNLAAMGTMSAAFGSLIGYSDHTPGIEIALAAVALGATVIEKHLTLDNKMTGPDHRASLEPQEFTRMVEAIRLVESALGHGRKEPAASESNTASVARKSLVANRDIPVGATLTGELVGIKRPGTGLPAAMMPQVLGRTAREQISEGALITMEMLS